MTENESMSEECVSLAGHGRQAGQAVWRALLGCLRGALLILVILAGTAEAAAAEFVLHSYAIIAADATLQVSGRKVRFDAVYIPPTGRFCESRLRPVECGSRAAVALRFKLQGFVKCQVKRKDPDGTHVSVCWNNGVDLGEWLIREGWALATRDAPFSYIAAERIARAQNRGVWGFSADAFSPAPAR